MTNQTRNILTGNISDKELTQTSSLKLMEAKEKMRDIEDEINREFRIIDLTEILINKIKLIGYDIEDIKLEKWDTPKAFIQSINKFNYI